MILYRRYVVVGKADQWQIWDLRREVFVGKFGDPDPDYTAISRDVAAMRVRDWQHRP